MLDLIPANSLTGSSTHGPSRRRTPSSNQGLSNEYVLCIGHTPLIDSVLAPGGCTIAGLLAMEDGKVRSTIARAIQIATERASELGQPAKK